MATLNEALSAALSAEIARSFPVSGGDINRAHRLTLTDGTQVFMKSNGKAGPDFFRAEADGLEALRATETIGVPRVLALGEAEDVGSFLVLEWIESARQVPNFWEDFGRALAAMHRAEVKLPAGRFGWKRDNYIGSTPQLNRPRERWIDFFRDCRLAPQFKRAVRWLDNRLRNRAERLMERLGDFLVEPERPSLLHGDLWSGNFVTGSDGRAWLIDPAVYVGHGEADLAMTELFGGFPDRFYRAYREVNPLAPGYDERRDLYNLYHLLNHLNLFGGGYLGAVERIVNRYAGEK